MSCWGQTQAVQVHISGSDYPVEFADTSISFTNQQRIASDMTTVFSLVTSFDNSKGDEIDTGVFQLMPSASALLLAEEGDNLVIIDNNNMKGIRINKILSDKYLHAFTLLDTNTNAVQKAYEFVALMNSTNLVSQPIQVLRNLSHIVPIEPLSDDEVRVGVAGMQTYKYPGISVLNFSLQPRIEADGVEVPVVDLFAARKSDVLKNIAFPILYHDRRWGFGKIW